MRAYVQCTGVLALCLGLLSGCGETSAPAGTGSLNLSLELADGVFIDEVAWTISGRAMEPMSGTINTSAPGSTASVEVFGLPVGQGYLVELQATDVSREVTCKGDAEFNVEVGVSTEVLVMLNCKRPTNLGGVRVNGELNICAQLAKVVVSPLQTSIGNEIDLSALGEDVESDDISYAWTATGGSIADASAQEATYRCEVVGEHVVTITVSDDDGEHCMDDWTVAVTCVEGPECINLADFPQGVAAGDVDQSSVMLWARASTAGPVRFEYGRDPDFAQPPDGCIDYDEGGVPGAGVVDPTIPAKVEITALVDGTQYYYRAARGRCDSAVARACKAPGSFRTLHASGFHGLRFGVSSCFLGNSRPFVSIKNVPERNLDMFVALGDNVYADSPNLKFYPRCSGNAETLDQFRCKHEVALSQMYSQDDNMLARARASTAFFADIDDHDVANDFAGGAPPTETFRPSKTQTPPAPFCNETADPPDPNCGLAFTNQTDVYNDALRAFHEYYPIVEERYGQTGDPRTVDRRKLYRYRTFGKDAALLMLDTRSFRAPRSLLAYQSGRTMLGAEQLNDLKDDLRDAQNRGITWKFVLVPQPMQNLAADQLTSADRFEGYAVERAEILDFIEMECISNVVFVSGDIHGTISNNLIYRILQPGDELPNPGSVDGRYSYTWEISTGAVAYIEPFGNAKLLGVQASVTLLGQPFPGLDFEFTVPPLRSPYQRWNKDIPATLSAGSSYTSVETFGWTEFAIGRENQQLTVRTWGIDPYPEASNGDSNKYPEERVTQLLEAEEYQPKIVSEFTVAPVGEAPRCATCRGDGGVCLTNSRCCSGICKAGFCTSQCTANGGACLLGNNAACCSGVCNARVCTGCIRRDALCEENADCCSGSCSRFRLLKYCD